jgi:hypothetical protein
MNSAIRDAMASLSSINQASGDVHLLRNLVRRLNARATYAWQHGKHDEARALRAQANDLEARLPVRDPNTAPAGRVRPDFMPGIYHQGSGSLQLPQWMQSTEGMYYGS